MGPPNDSFKSVENALYMNIGISNSNQMTARRPISEASGDAS